MKIIGWIKKKIKTWFQRNFKRKMTLEETLRAIKHIARENNVIIYFTFSYTQDEELKKELIRIAESMQKN